MGRTLFRRLRGDLHSGQHPRALTVPGSLYLGLIALLPSVAFILLNANQNFPFGGTSILIIVGVGLDTVKQIESQLQQRNYEGFLR